MKLHAAMLLDQAEKMIPLGAVGVFERRGVQDCDDLAVPRNLPCMQHMLHTIPERRIENDCVVKMPVLKLQKVRPNHIQAFGPKGRVPLQVNLTTIDRYTAPVIVSPCGASQRQVTVSGTGLQNTHPFLALEERPRP
ncbi:MAG: hypothetical protein PHV99_03465, partial [Candidatus Pacebacteria bacterium]|nr:hypothetical protein [Candidatus Paceibacterota bacterium]